MGSPAILDEWAGSLSHSDYKVVRDYLDRVLRATYRNGYNDHARSRAYQEQVYGPHPSPQRVTRRVVEDSHMPLDEETLQRLGENMANYMVGGEFASKYYEWLDHDEDQ